MLIDRNFLEGEKREKKKRGKEKRRRKFFESKSISAKPSGVPASPPVGPQPPFICRLFYMRKKLPISACHVPGPSDVWIQSVQGACDRHSYRRSRYLKGIVCDELATVIYVHVPPPSSHDAVW